MNFTLNRYNIFLFLTLFIVVFYFDKGICQNPLDIESRLTPTLEQKEKLRPNEENSTIISATDYPLSNPFDIKKEPNAQISKPKKPKESKRIVNTTASKVGKLIKIGILLVCFKNGRL